MRKAINLFSVIVLISFLIPRELPAQAPARYAQQIAVLKTLVPELKTIGMLGTTLTDANIQDVVRAGMGQGVQIVVGRPKNPREISEIYKKMVKERNIQVVWITDPKDETMLGMGYEFLRSTALPDKIGICVPVTSLVGTGAFCSIQLEDGSLVSYCSTKVADALGLSIPSGADSQIKYVSK